MLAMNRYALAVASALCLVGWWLAGHVAASDALAAYQRKGRVTNSDLAREVADPRMYAFDLSPTGRLLAVLVRSGDRVKTARWLMLLDAGSGQVLRQCQTWESAATPRSEHYYPPQVLFSPDEKFLVIREQEQVRIIDVATLRTVRTIGARETEPRLPVSICGSRRNDRFAISFGRGWQSEGYERVPVHVEMIDVSDGTRQGSWEADDILQALSPDGSRAAVSDWNARGPLLKVAVVDSRTGTTVAVLDGGFRFTRRDGDQPKGRVVARFLSDDEVVLSPDGGWDSAGHYAGGNLRVVRVADGKTMRTLEPDGGGPLGPTGDIAISNDDQAVMAVSWFFPPRFYTHPHEPPPVGSGPELLVFLKTQRFRLSAVIKPSGQRGRIDGTSLLPFRPSSDASVIAMQEDVGITVFRRSGQ